MRRLGVAVVLVILLGGCSDDDDGEVSATTVAEAPGPIETTTAAPPEVAAIRVVSQNILHGIACPPETDGCRLDDRVALFMSQLAAADCPDLVSLQEANEQIRTAVLAHPAEGCDYELVWDGDPGLDRELVLSRFEVIDSRRFALPGLFRTGYLVRVAAPIGVVDFVSTHLASSSDNRPCDEATCPPPCLADDDVNACQARQLLTAIDEVTLPEATVILGGDMNAEVGEPAIEAILADGFIDSHLAVGAPECDPANGAWCTSGRIDDALIDMEDPASLQSSRIDFLFFRGARPCTTGPGTGLFNADPADGDLAYPSDHTGVALTLQCEATEVAAESSVTLPPAPTTTVAEGAGEPDVSTAAAITEAYETFFNGDVTDVELKLSFLEDAERLREFFVERFEAVKDLAAATRVRIDAIALSSATTADVTYTILLEGNVVLDHLPGHAVLVDGRWLITRRTYCDVSTQGQDTIPEPCRAAP